MTSSFVQKLLAKHLPKAGDALVDCFFQPYTNNSATYDASDGSGVDPFGQYGVKAILASFSFTKTQSDFKGIDGQTIMEEDKKAILPVAELPSGIVPRKDDILIVDFSKEVDPGGFSDSGFGNPCVALPSGVVQYNIIGMNIDPLKSVYLLHLRPIDESE